MSRWCYGSVGVLVLALLGLGVVREGGREPSPPLGEGAQGAVVAVAGDARASPPPAATDSLVSEPVTADRERHLVQTRLAPLEARIARLEQQVQNARRAASHLDGTVGPVK